MNEDPFKNFEEFINYCNKFYKENSSDSQDTNNSQNDGYYCGDIPGGFQCINPQFLLVMGELLGNVMSGKMPFNIQNVIGNWLQLVGQAIETFNAQQQYMQSGPGRYYDIRNLNIDNPFCSQNQTSSQQSDYDDSSQYINRNSTYQNTSTTGESKESEVEKLKKDITVLEEKIEKLKNEIKEIKRDSK